MSLADFLKPYLSTKYITGLVLLGFVLVVVFFVLFVWFSLMALN